MEGLYRPSPFIFFEKYAQFVVSKLVHGEVLLEQRELLLLELLPEQLWKLGIVHSNVLLNANHNEIF
ncbi:hypothetical protein LPB144_10955 [Christiangramia salexigens]|uniref:Uncharacterized protein n=1 Tax=Christiangramia salexigens TaxID=1913577 RepID=A0A1L3J718_9FLAO|nr:hypothetical protein LPB144_10955 [Christiangramia salexigens]